MRSVVASNRGARGHDASALVSSLAIAALVIAACASQSGQPPPSGAGGGSLLSSDGGADPDAPLSIDAPGSCLGALTCATAGASCGPIGDGCGGVLQCGTCVAPETCGGGGTPSVCGGHSGCVPKTCAQLGASCGPVADGCGGLLHCGTCSAQSLCGAGGTPNVCSEPVDGGGCTNLCLQQVACNGSPTTTVSGTVYAPNGNDPLYGALVYVPNAPVAPFAPGVACDQCGAQASGSPLVSVVTGPDGKFQLEDVPAGSSIPLVLQLGRWRRQVTIPSVAACTDTPLPAALTRLPRNQSEGDIPRMAFATGSVDALECVLRKIGVDDAEVTAPPAQGGTGRINLYRSNGADVGPSTPPVSDLYGSLATLSQYDMVLFPCEGGQIQKPAAARQNVIQYANAGGRVFTTHYSYVWLYADPPFSSTATFLVNQPPLSDLTGVLDTSFPRGHALAEWLFNVGASTTFGRIPLKTIRHDVDGVVAPSQRWISADPAISATAVMHYTFDTPVGAPSHCGRVLFDDFHVEDASTAGLTYPAECPGGPMTPQEKLLEFMLFDLASCIPPSSPPPPACPPRTCAQQGISCGPAGDGCGETLDCGTCPAGQTCGGGGTPSTCGMPSCTPGTCASAGATCGPVADGCGGLVTCGTCTLPETCGGGGQANVCGAVSTL